MGIYLKRGGGVIGGLFANEICGRGLIFRKVLFSGGLLSEFYVTSKISVYLKLTRLRQLFLFFPQQSILNHHVEQTFIRDA